jgi:hypothetical protein
MSSFKFEVWPTEFRSINQYFGANPGNYAEFGLPGHEGLDIMAPHGSKIFAVAPGRVGMVNGRADNHNYGIHVRIDHVDDYQTIYAHLAELKVSVGQQVQAGDLLGLADNTGNSFGSHLHLTLKKKGAKQGNWPYNIMDPTPFLMPLMGFQKPAGPYTEGWAYTDAIFIADDLAQAASGGINLRKTPHVNADLIDLVPAGTIMIVTGNKSNLYTPVKVATSALANYRPPAPPPPEPPPPPTISTVDGWAWSPYLTITSNQAVVGQYGINLRADPDRNGHNIGLVKGGTTVSVIGPANGEYSPIRARRVDFMGPISLPEAPPAMSIGDDDDFVIPPTTTYLGWAWTPYLTITGTKAVTGRFGINLRNKANRNSENIGLLKGGAEAQVVGQSRGEYTPVLAQKADVLNIPDVIPTIEQPDPLPGDVTPTEPEQPIHDTTPGWAFSTQITVSGNTAVAGPYGINLRDNPQRSANNIGFVPANAKIIVTGPRQGEYTPVRVDDTILQPPFGTTTPPIDTTEQPEIPHPDPTPFGQAKIGIHASADPGISDTEIKEIGLMRPGIIKVLSFHEPKAIKKLATNHPDISWIVRVFYSFGGRKISPEQFVKDSITSTRSALNHLQGKDVVIELHNEPNLTPEGLYSSWQDGESFARWWLEVLRLYRNELPGMRFIYPGLSPGHDVINLKQDHIRFIEASRAAVDAADGLGIHIYWSNVYPMSTALMVLDDYISRFRFKPIWVTEASNNKSGTSTYHKGLQYLDFWRELQKRPTVQGVTYFVASASDAAFKEEIWVGRNIASVVGRR